MDTLTKTATATVAKTTTTITALTPMRLTTLRSKIPRVLLD